MAEHVPEFWESRLRDGDREALGTLFEAHCGGLRRWVESRLDPRLRGRLSASDVLQEIYLAAEGRIEHFRSTRDMPFGIWIRLLADQRLVEVHRKHLMAQARSVKREVSIHRLDGSAGSGVNLATRLATDQTSPSSAAVHHETMNILTEAVDAMEPRDREVLILRHFDELSNDEVARFLDIPKGTASKRYIRALGRLRDVLERIPGLLAESTVGPSQAHRGLMR